MPYGRFAGRHIPGLARPPQRAQAHRCSLKNWLLRWLAKDLAWTFGERRRFERPYGDMPDLRSSGEATMRDDQSAALVSPPPRIFDHHWESETEWHRKWKDLFPKECQEACHRAESGERHLADVKTAHGQVLEFQHSAISEAERTSREAIYGLMCSVVNGHLLKNDRANFIAALRLGMAVQANPLSLTVGHLPPPPLGETGCGSRSRAARNL